MEKKCIKCLQFKPKDDFQFTSAGNYFRKCKVCTTKGRAVKKPNPMKEMGLTYKEIVAKSEELQRRRLNNK